MQFIKSVNRRSLYVNHQCKRSPNFVAALFVLSLFVTGCHRSDAKTQQLLAGTWDIDRGYGVHGTVIISSNGNWKSQWTGCRDGHTDILEGTQFIKAGLIFETVTKANSTNYPVPRVSRMRIVHLDDQEYVLRGDGANYDIVAKKIQAAQIFSVKSFSMAN